MAPGLRERSGRALRFLVAALVVVVAAAVPQAGQAASFSPRDLSVLGRAVAFLVPPPSTDAFVAVAYSPATAGSRQDAEAIVAMIGPGLQVDRTLLRPKLVDVNTLETSGFSVVIAAIGADGPQLSATVRAAHALCVTKDLAAVRAALCTMAITSEPRVEIVVNHEASTKAGIEFAAAFRMMIREI